MISSSDNRTGEIFRLTTLGSPRIFISSHELVDEVCNEERFGKVVTQGLKEIRNGTHDGLFTANYPRSRTGLSLTVYSYLPSVR